ncbi:MAG: hypothetical protein ACT4PT_03320 [Methanobacteriota archaeon]
MRVEAHASPTKLRVYRLLREGYGIRFVADRLGVSRQAVHLHSLELERIGALRRVPGAKSPLMFEAGPRAADFEAAARQGGDRPGRSGRQAPLAAARVHGGGYRFRVVAGPDREPPWAKRWLASGVQNQALRRAYGGRTLRFWLTNGAGGRTLVIQPPEEYVSHPETLRAVRETRRAQVAAAAREFAREYRFVLQGAIEDTQPVEIAFAAPGLARTGTPGEDAVWVDTSEGEGAPEIETGSPAIAAAVAELPRWRDDLERRLGYVNEELEAHRAVLGQIVTLQEKAALAQRQVVTALVPPGPEVA